MIYIQPDKHSLISYWLEEVATALLNNFSTVARGWRSWRSWKICHRCDDIFSVQALYVYGTSFLTLRAIVWQPKYKTKDRCVCVCERCRRQAVEFSSTLLEEALLNQVADVKFVLSASMYLPMSISLFLIRCFRFTSLEPPCFDSGHFLNPAVVI